MQFIKPNHAPLLAILLAMFTLTGCGQRRYQPSQWRPSPDQSTLPQASNTQVAINGSLPVRGGGTLVLRGGSLPLRNGSTLVVGSTTLAVRDGTLPRRVIDGPDVIWDTSPKQDMPQRRPTVEPGWLSAGGSTLPGRAGAGTLPMRGGLDGGTLPRRGASVLPDHLMPRRNSDTLPGRRSFGNSLPRR